MRMSRRDLLTAASLAVSAAVLAVGPVRVDVHVCGEAHAEIVVLRDFTGESFVGDRGDCSHRLIADARKAAAWL